MEIIEKAALLNKEIGKLNEVDENLNSDIEEKRTLCLVEEKKEIAKIKEKYKLKVKKDIEKSLGKIIINNNKLLELNNERIKMIGELVIKREAKSFTEDDEKAFGLLLETK